MLHDPSAAAREPLSGHRALFNKTVEPAYLAMQDAVRSFRPDVIVRHHIPLAAGCGEQHKISRDGGADTVDVVPSGRTDDPAFVSSRSVQRGAFRADPGQGKFALRWFIDRPVNRARVHLASPIRDVFFHESKGGDRVLGLWSKHFRPPSRGDPPGSKSPMPL